MKYIKNFNENIEIDYYTSNRYMFEDNIHFTKTDQMVLKNYIANINNINVNNKYDIKTDYEWVNKESIGMNVVIKNNEIHYYIHIDIQKLKDDYYLISIYTDMRYKKMEEEINRFFYRCDQLDDTIETINNFFKQELFLKNNI